MPRRPPPLLLAVLAAVSLILASCSDGEGEADPTPAGIGDDETNATVPPDDDGAVGESEGDDSQTDATSSTMEPAGSGGDVVPTSDRARVVGSFDDRDLDLLLTEDTRCAVEEPQGAGGEALAAVTGATSDGAHFTLEWSVDAGRLHATLAVDETTWTVERDLDDGQSHDIRLTRNGEVLLQTTFRSADGRSADAQLYVNCQPVDG